MYVLLALKEYNICAWSQLSMLEHTHTSGGIGCHHLGGGSQTRLGKEGEREGGTALPAIHSHTFSPLYV